MSSASHHHDATGAALPPPPSVRRKSYPPSGHHPVDAEPGIVFDGGAAGVLSDRHALARKGLSSLPDAAGSTDSQCSDGRGAAILAEDSAQRKRLPPWAAAALATDLHHGPDRLDANNAADSAAVAIRSCGATPAPLADTFRGRTVLLTGVTGFVGKALLWKLLAAFPDLRRVYALIRPSPKDNDVAARLDKEVLATDCFSGLRDSMPAAAFDADVRSRVVAVAGDLTKPRLGLSAADYARVTAEVNVVISVAATVNFDERLDNAAKMNVQGPLALLQLAESAPRLEGFVHMSTCYVNHPRKVSGAGGPAAADAAPVNEQLYPLPYDDAPDAMLKKIVAMSPADADAFTASHVRERFGYPNTYTFTKSLAEHLLARRAAERGVRFSIVRPAIVGAAAVEPHVGWLDNITAASGVFLRAGLGLLRDFRCEAAGIGDIVPVDVVVNATLKLTHATVRAPEALLPLVCHAGSTGGSGDANARRVTWGEFFLTGNAYAMLRPFPKAVGAGCLNLVADEVDFNRRAKALAAAAEDAAKASAADPKSAPKKRRAAVLKKRLAFTIDMSRRFWPFTMYQWTFRNEATRALDVFVAAPKKADGSKEDEGHTFVSDASAAIGHDWRRYVFDYMHGLARFVLKAPGAESATARASPPSEAEYQRLLELARQRAAAEEEQRVGAKL